MALSHDQECHRKAVLPASLIEALEALWVEAQGATTLTGLVVVVLRGMRALGVVLIQCQLEERDQEFRQRGLKLVCPKCGRGLAGRERPTR